MVSCGSLFVLVGCFIDGVSVLFRLLTPPGTPVFPSLETESHKAKVCHLGSNVRPTALKPRVSLRWLHLIDCGV